MTELKESLQAEGKSDEEVQTSSPSIKDRIRGLQGNTKPNENYQETIHEGVAAAVREEKSQTKLNQRINELEGIRTKLESQQKKLKDNLVQEKEKGANDERSRVQLNEKINELEIIRAELESQQKKLKGNLVQEKEKEASAERSLLQVFASLTELQEKRIQVNDDKKQMFDILFKGTLEPVDDQILNSEASLNDWKAVKANLETETKQLNLIYSEDSRLDHDQKTILSKVQASQKELEDKNLKLQEQNKHLKDLLSTRKREAFKQGMLPRFLSDAEQHNIIFQRDTAINGMDELKSVIAESVDTGIYNSNSTSTSHFVNPLLANGGPPVWEEDSSAKCILEGDHCIILLKQFCWVKYEINDKIVVAKRLKVFTAGKSLHPNDIIAEMEVGYHMDLPGRVENMSAIRGMDFYQTKPFVFVKEGKVPLQLVLSKIVPKEWTYITPDENPKIISYKSIADDRDTSCPFVVEKSRSSERSPYCIFKIVQGIESVELSMRF